MYEARQKLQRKHSKKHHRKISTDSYLSVFEIRLEKRIIDKKATPKGG